MALRGRLVDGTGGATRAFLHADSRRIAEIEQLLGFRAYPGSLNVRLDCAFSWDVGQRGVLLDVVRRGQGLDSEWAPRPARFIPVHIGYASGVRAEAWAFRFDGEHYSRAFLELIAPYRLRDRLPDPDVYIWRQCS